MHLQETKKPDRNSRKIEPAAATAQVSSLGALDDGAAHG